VKNQRLIRRKTTSLHSLHTHTHTHTHTPSVTFPAERPACRNTVGGRAAQIHFSEGNHVSPLSTLNMFCVLTVVNQRLQIVFSNHTVSKWNEWALLHLVLFSITSRPSPTPPRLACRTESDTSLHESWALGLLL